MRKSCFLTLTAVLLTVPAFSAPTAEKAAAKAIEFHIKAGTGSAPWNTPENPVVLEVGDTFILVNDDPSVPSHYLHTPGVPCRHGRGPIAFGQREEFEITDEANPVETVLYDHHFGPTARFYVLSTKAAPDAAPF